MTSAQDIKPGTGLERAVSNSWDQHNLSTSPTATFSLAAQQSLSSSFGGSLAHRGSVAEKPLKPFDTQDVKILLLENINKAGQDILKKQGYQVEALKTSLPEDQLIEKIR
jgi:D-3-phosphoglycerate dehydrogenase